MVSGKTLVMPRILFLLCASYCFANASSQTVASDVSKKNLPLVEALITSLQEWKPDDGDCLRATRELLEGVRNHTLWATWVWDSMQLPAGSLYGVWSHVGNYDQCLQTWSSEQHPGVRSQYCLVRVNVPDEELALTSISASAKLGPDSNVADYFKTSTHVGRRFNQYSFGACLPAVCSPSSVAEISARLLRLTHSPPGDTLVDPRDCIMAGDTKNYPAGFFFFWTVVAALLLTTIGSTLSNYTTKHGILATIQESFCMSRNYRALFTRGPDDLTCLHGLRALTAVIVVFIHEMDVAMLCPITNGLHIEQIFNTWGLVVMHVEVVVDTFFTMSGLLLVRGIEGTGQKSVLQHLLKRYIRLIGPFALCILYIATTMEHLFDGPLWRYQSSLETDICKQYWWKSLLMISNDIVTACPIVTWYISCEYQLAVLGIILVLLARKSRSLGGAAGAAVAAAVTANLAYDVYSRRLDAVPFNYKTIIEKRNATHLNYTYLSSPARAGPYLVGMLMGYFIITYKPAHYRQYINKIWSIAITGISIVVICSLISLAVVFAGRPYDAAEAAVVTATNRTLWGLAICGIIAVCEYGSLRTIPGILSWSGFIPLSKLSYCIYLVHIIVFYSQKLSARGAITLTLLNMLISGTGVLVVACVLSLVMHLTVEAPIINLSNAMFGEKLKLMAKYNSTAEVDHNGTKTGLHNEIKECSCNRTKQDAHNTTKGNSQNGFKGNLHNGNKEDSLNGTKEDKRNRTKGDLPNEIKEHLHNGIKEHLHNGIKEHLQNGIKEHLHNGNKEDLHYGIKRFA